MPVAAILVTITIAGAGAIWGASKFTTRADVQRIVERESPYVEDKARVRNLLDRYRKEREQLLQIVQQIKVEQALINGKLDQLLNYHRRARRSGRSP